MNKQQIQRQLAAKRMAVSTAKQFLTGLFGATLSHQILTAWGY